MNEQQITQELREAQEQVLNKYKGLIWYTRYAYFDNSGDEYVWDSHCEKYLEETIYFGEYELVEKIMNMKFRNRVYVISQFDITKHPLKDIVNAKDTYQQLYRPRKSGDIVEYKGVRCTVTGFYNNNMVIIYNGERISIPEEEMLEVKLIHSIFYNM